MVQEGVLEVMSSPDFAYDIDKDMMEFLALRDECFSLAIIFYPSLPSLFCAHPGHVLVSSHVKPKLAFQISVHHASVSS
jgi:hypothetical protein